MSFVRESTVKATRKRHRCDGCGRAIEVGTTASRWAGMTDGDFGSAIYHPDCRKAEVAYNRRIGSSHSDEWYRLDDIDREDEPWLREKFPAVAERLFGPAKVTEVAHG